MRNVIFKIGIADEDCGRRFDVTCKRSYFVRKFFFQLGINEIYAAFGVIKSAVVEHGKGIDFGHYDFVNLFDFILQIPVRAFFIEHG